MFFAIILILTITGLVWAVNKLLSFKLCPVCAGVSGTWLLLTAFTLSGIIPNALSLLPVSIFMGGTVVGIAYQGEKSLPLARKYPVAWKLSTVVVGFPLVYSAVRNMSWMTFMIELAVLMITAYVFFVRRGMSGVTHTSHRGDAHGVQEIEKGLEKCC